MPSPRRVGRARVSAWLERWRPLLPVFSAELIVMIGFGSLLPVLPLFAQEHGIDAAQLGFIVAAWAVAKLIFEPVFGWWADRHRRKPQMVLGLVVFAVVSLLPLFFTSFLALFVLRFIAGAATGLYDPAARGMVVEGTDADERGEAFGYYGAFQVGGFAFGPAIGALGTAVFGGYGFPFAFTFVLSLAAAVVVARYVMERPHAVESGPLEDPFDVERRADPEPVSTSGIAVAPAGEVATLQAPLSAVFNRVVVAVLIIAFGLHLSFGTYEVVWSLYLVALGASIAWVGFTFVIFAVPEMVIAPVAGRIVDRRGPIPFVVGGAAIIMASGAVYARATEPVLPTLVVPFEAAATAAMSPALFAMLARGTPQGRASTTQGLFGATATLALIVASLTSGSLFELGIGLPFWFFVVGMGVCVTIGLAIYRSAAPRPARLAGALPDAAPD
jgi:DHA1 family multidrug resistance protein-like MFS transporter